MKRIGFLLLTSSLFIPSTLTAMRMQRIAGQQGPKSNTKDLEHLKAKNRGMIYKYLGAFPVLLKLAQKNHENEKTKNEAYETTKSELRKQYNEVLNIFDHLNPENDGEGFVVSGFRKFCINQHDTNVLLDTASARISDKLKLHPGYVPRQSIILTEAFRKELTNLDHYSVNRTLKLLDYDEQTSS